MVLQGSGTGNPGLPLTDNQKKQEVQKKEQAKRAQLAAAAQAQQAAQTPATQQVQPVAAATKLSTPVSSWATDCNNWKKGVCERGISCWFKHAGIPTDAGRCFICGKEGHGVKDCEAPGGKKDPEHDKHWEEYRERKKKAEEKGKGCRKRTRQRQREKRARLQRPAHVSQPQLGGHARPSQRAMPWWTVVRSST